ncbi:MAG: hypothetical protein RLZZ179_648 [Verrucomicrobiota bacterium]|jgi:hypothetical protein
MSLTKSIVEDAALPGFGVQRGKRVKSEIGRVKSWGAFPISLFTLHSTSSVVALIDVLLPTLRSGDFDVADPNL